MMPRWSPAGETIAYFNSINGTIDVIESDGTGARTLAGAAAAYDLHFSWSPDGRWLIVRNATHNRLELVEVGSGMMLPLAFTNGLVQPAWRP